MQMILRAGETEATRTRGPTVSGLQVPTKVLPMVPLSGTRILSGALSSSPLPFSQLFVCF